MCEEPCVKSTSKDGLILMIDISDNKSWDLNENLIVCSTQKWSKAISDNIFLKDYGITSFDYAQADFVYQQEQITPFDTKLCLEPTKFNLVLSGSPIIVSGITYPFSAITQQYSGDTYDYSILPVTGDTIGNYFDLQGGWLWNNFALEEYPYQLLPKRYLKGFALRTWIKLSENTFNSIEDDSDGFIIYMGAKAENKYNVGVSGETNIYTSEDNYLSNENRLHLTGYTKDIIEYGIYDNVIGFRFTSDKKIGYVRINEEGYVESDYSDKCISFNDLPILSGGNEGWVELGVNFKPNKILTEADIDCSPRLGDLTIYFNGRPLHTFKNFREFIFRGFDEFREMQINVPYGLSWGGGTYGLRHHYHFDYSEFNFYEPFDDVYISGNTNYDTSLLSISATTENYLDRYVVDGFIYDFSGNPSLSGTTEFEIDFIPKIFALSNREYEIITYFRNDTLFQSGSTTTITLEVNNVEYQLVEDEPYVITNKSDIDNTTDWFIIRKVIKLRDDVLPENIEVSLRVISNLSLRSNNYFNFTSVSRKAPDILYQDERKIYLLLEQLFGGETHLGIQKLKIYDRSLLPSEWLNDFSIDAKKFGYRKIKGGRIIYVY